MKSISDLLKDFDKSSKEYVSLMRVLPRKIGVLGVAATKRNFLLQGMEIGGTFKMWKKRSPVTDKMYTQGRGKKGKSIYKGSVFSAKNPILIQTGNLKSDTTYAITENGVEIGCNLNQVPYAKLMQEGGNVDFNGKSVSVPARPFLGHTNYLTKKITDFIKLEQEKSLNKFKK